MSAVIGLAAASQVLAQPDQQTLAARGEQLFNGDLGCANCHSPDSTFAPPLVGVYGRKIAGAKGFIYSAALKSQAGSWSDANLDAFLANAQAFAPGTSTDARVSDAGQRTAVIAYLKTLKAEPAPSRR
jgi:cytochrome c